MSSSLAIVLYEDSMNKGAGGSYPMHDLVLRAVLDTLADQEVEGEFWRLSQCIDKNPRKGIDTVIRDVEDTSLIAGGGQLCLLIDRDRVAQHLKLNKRAEDSEVIAALKEKSDAPERLHVFFLDPHTEGLLRHIRDCGPQLVQEDTWEKALQKKLNDRDLVFQALKAQAQRAIRDCMRQHQRSLDEMIRHLASLYVETLQLVV